MITGSETELNGVRGYELQNASMRVFLPIDFGPRVLGLFLGKSQNLLAELPEAVLPVAGEAGYSLRGGHRLWVSPEIPTRTYAEDDRPPGITLVENGADMEQQADRAGFQKSWRLRMHPQKAELVIDHRITNQGERAVEAAPWAVTMLRTGGTALMPLQAEPDSSYALGPNRQLAIWPYTDIHSPHLVLSNSGVILQAKITAGALKIGSPNPSGWLAYSNNGVLFVKRTVYRRGAVYPDCGASHQIYCDGRTLELETLGPLAVLQPGESAEHQEVWHLYQEASWPLEIKGLFDVYSLGKSAGEESPAGDGHQFPSHQPK